MRDGVVYDISYHKSHKRPARACVSIACRAATMTSRSARKKSFVSAFIAVCVMETRTATPCGAPQRGSDACASRDDDRTRDKPICGDSECTRYHQFGLCCWVLGVILAGCSDANGVATEAGHADAIRPRPRRRFKTPLRRSATNRES